MTLNDIKNIVEKYDSIIIYRHVQPDGDALGSQFGLQTILKENYPNKYIYTVGSQSGYFDNFFPINKELDEYIYSHSLAITVDTPSIERLEGICIEKCLEIIKIDHHIKVEDFTPNEWVNTDASSVCEMIALLCKEVGWKMPKQAANFLYFGLITDSNRFMYCYKPDTFEAAKFLSENGADGEGIYTMIYEETELTTRFWGYCQSHFSKTGYGVAYNKLTPEVLISCGIDPHQGSGMVNALANMKYIDVWAHFSELEDGTVRAELRSKGLPVNEVAKQFGGGGHVRAAGCTLLNWDEVDICLDRLDRMVFNNKPYHKELDVAINAVKQASKIVLDIYNSGDFNTQTKEDNSPVTKADIASETYLRDILSKIFPDYGFLSEETPDNDERLDKEFVWIIDPVDGTKDFVEKDGEFAINLALCKDHKIVLGVIGVPCKQTVYYAVENGGAFKDEKGVVTRIFTSKRSTNLIGVRSRYHLAMQDSKYFRQFEELIPEVYTYGSAYKFGLIAEGKADVNCKFDPVTKQWDIAPGVIIIKEAGGSFTKPDGSEIEFNTKDYINRDGYIVLNKFNKGLLK